jgi:hypothetical protein
MKTVVLLLTLISLNAKAQDSTKIQLIAKKIAAIDKETKDLQPFRKTAKTYYNNSASKDTTVEQYTWFKDSNSQIIKLTRQSYTNKGTFYTIVYFEGLKPIFLSDAANNLHVTNEACWIYFQNGEAFHKELLGSGNQNIGKLRLADYELIVYNLLMSITHK